MKPPLIVILGLSALFVFSCTSRKLNEPVNRTGIAGSDQKTAADGICDLKDGQFTAQLVNKVTKALTDLDENKDRKITEIKMGRFFNFTSDKKQAVHALVSYVVQGVDEAAEEMLASVFVSPSKCEIAGTTTAPVAAKLDPVDGCDVNSLISNNIRVRNNMSESKITDIKFTRRASTSVFGQSFVTISGESTDDVIEVYSTYSQSSKSRDGVDYYLIAKSDCHLLSQTTVKLDAADKAQAAASPSPVPSAPPAATKPAKKKRG